MKYFFKILSIISNRFLWLYALSIKQLTLLGFTLVACPLVVALLYGASQVDQLAKQGESAIITSAELSKVNKVLSTSLNKMERYASQYLVLRDQELIDSYLAQEQGLLMVLMRLSTQVSDEQLLQVIKSFQSSTEKMHQLMTVLPVDMVTLEQLQSDFGALTVTNHKINLRINELNHGQAQQLKLEALNLRQTFFTSLILIPITVLMALLFIILITKPFKKLVVHIQQLEQGNFEKEITLKGSPEINDIVNALEVMRTRLHALELQKSSFIRHISHELKTPLAAIREGAELLYDNSVGSLNDQQQEVSDIIRRSVTRLQHLIEELLEFNIVLDSTSLQDGQMVDLTGVIEEAIAGRKLDLLSISQKR